VVADRMRPRVVIAEDEAIIRLDLREILEGQGYDVVGEAGRGDEAVDLVRALLPDLVILDVKMPALDGLAVARLVTEERLAAVLVLTAFSQRELVEDARDAGALAYLVKPFQEKDLVPAIEVALARHAERMALERNVADLEARLEARKLVDRAKGLLMDRHGLDEQSAWRFIQTAAMNGRTNVGLVAHQVLAGELVPVPRVPPG
jgi:response regulator NasT